MKEIVRHYTEEENEFMRKYGESNFYFWETLSDSQKADYLKLERLYTDFFELYNEHYEDLKLYALYHRNVNIQNCNQDPTSVLFFAWNKKKVFGFKEYELIEDEQELEAYRIINGIAGKVIVGLDILGFKDKIEREASKIPSTFKSKVDWITYYKAKLALLYLDNEEFFIKFCMKYTNVDITPKEEKDDITADNLRHLRERITNRSEDYEFSAFNDLNYEQLKLLFEHSENINSEYKMILNQLETDGFNMKQIEYYNDWLCNTGEMKKQKKRFKKINREDCFRWYISRDGTNEEKFHFSSYPLFRIWKENIESMRKWQKEKELQYFKEQEEQKRIEEAKRRREEDRRRRYNIIHRHSRDCFLSFDETNHTYSVERNPLQSVTNIVENCFPKFDAQLHAKTTAAKMGMTEEEVIAMWEQKGKESRELGTAMHQKIESYYQGKDSGEDDAFRLFKVFADKVKLEPYRTEWAVYDTDYNIAGTIDFVDCQDGIFTIYDWKRSDKIIANGMPVKVSKYQEKGLYPLEHLENCAYYHYALQLSLYKFILEKNYDIKVSDLRLGIFHPSYDKPYVLKMPYLENEVRTLMELRSEVIL